MKKSEPKFNYAVGFYWNGKDGSVGCYASGSEVHFGTLKEAKDYREYCQRQAKRDKERGDFIGDKVEREYKVFMLVEVPE